MPDPSTQSAAEHEEFSQTGRTESLQPALRRHGPALLGFLAESGDQPEPQFVRVFAEFAGRRFRGAPEGWLTLLLRAAADACPEPDPARLGRRALFLTAQAGLALADVATVLRKSEAEVAEAMQAETLAAAGVAAETPALAFHLSPSAVAALCAGTLSDAETARAGAHVAFCMACRAQAEAIADRLGNLFEPLPALDAALLDRTLRAARDERLAQARWPRALRFAGLKPGARFRPVRLGVVSVLALLLLASAVTSIRHAQWKGRRVETELSLDAAPQMLSGATTAISVRVRPTDLTKSKPSVAVNVPVTAVLQGDLSRELGTAEGRTGPDGVVTLNLKVGEMEKASESGWLRVFADVDGERRQASLPVQLARRLRQHLSADKPTYQPGQTIHLRGLSLNAGDGRPLAGKPARIEVLDPRGNRIADVQAEVSKTGVSSADVELSSGCALGNYSARLTVAETQSVVPLVVERYTLPPFAVTVTPEVRSTDGRAPFFVDVNAKFTTGVPMGRGMARLTAFVDGQEAFNEAVAIKDGRARFKVTIPSYLTDLRYRPPTTIGLHAAVRDPAGRAEEGRGGLELQGDAMSVTLLSEAPSVRRNLPRANRILVRAERPDGSPVQTSVALFAPGDGELETVGAGERLGETTTNADGMATLDLPPAFFGRPLAVLATDPKDKKQYWTSMAAPPMREGSLVLGCERSLLRAGDKLVCEVFVPSPEARAVRVEHEGRVVAMAFTPPTQGLHKVELPLPVTAPGLLRLAMDAAPDADAVHVLAAPHDGLRVSLSGLEPRQPGEEVTLRMKVTNEAGQPRVSTVGLAVVDAAVFARVAGVTPKAIIQRMFEQPNLGPAGMALLFPEPVESAPEGGDRWTARQQAESRWLLATTSTAGASVQRVSSLPADAAELSGRVYSARGTANEVFGVTVVALAGVLLLTLLVVFFWFRAAFVAVCSGLATALLLKLALGEWLGMRDQTVDPVALLLGLFALGGVFWSAKSRRKAMLRGAKAGGGWVNWAAPVAVLLLVGFVTMLGTRRYESRAPMATAVDAGESSGYGGGRDEGVQRKEEERAAAPTMATPPMAAPASVAQSEREEAKADKPKASSRLAAESKPAEPAAGAAAPAEPAVATRMDFPETLYWNPAAVVGDDGTGQVTFRVADSITTWEAYALASDADGLLGAGQDTLVVNKDFHVDLDVPTDLTVGDDVTLQIAAQNERAEAGAATLTATADPGLRLDTEPLAEPVTVPGHGIAGRFISLEALKAGEQFVTLAGQLGGLKDALKRAISVVPNGREVKQTHTGLVIDTVRRTIDLPADAFPDGREITLTLLGSPLAAALDGLYLQAREPHGAFEQQASVVYSNALILQALRATGRVNEAQERQLLRLLRLSYQDLLSYEVHGGGFAELGGGMRTHLTAWGLLVLSEISRHTYVDEQIIVRARELLARQQGGDGGFGTPAETAYVALAMMSQDKECLATEDKNKPWTADVRRFRAACQKVMNRLSEAFAIVEGVDAYTLALAADALVLAGPPHRARAEHILDELDRRAAIVGQGRDRRVTFQSRSATLYGSRGRSAEVETTALATHALISHGGRPDKAREALRALLVLRDRGGAYHSTQGTALALRALLAAALSAQAGGRASVRLDGTEVAMVEFDPSNVNEPRKVDLTDKVRPGAELQIVVDGWDGATDLAYRLTSHHFEPWTRPPAGRVDVAGEDEAFVYMTQRLDAKSYGLGDQATLTVEIDRAGARAPHGLLIAQVGLPPGFRLAPGAWEPGAMGPVHRVEPAARGLTLYLDDPGYGRTTLQVPLTAARAVRRVVVPRSRVYFAYQPSIEAQAPPVPVFVRRLLGDRTGG